MDWLIHAEFEDLKGKYKKLFNMNCSISVTLTVLPDLDYEQKL